MEVANALETFQTLLAGGGIGLCVGLFLGSHIKRFERKTQFDLGVNHGINQLWPYVVALWARDLARQHRNDACHKKTDGDNSA